MALLPFGRDRRAARPAGPGCSRRGRALPLAHARHHRQAAAGGAAIGRARARRSRHRAIPGGMGPSRRRRRGRGGRGRTGRRGLVPAAIDADHPGYGFVDAQVPEISIGVEAAWRGRGVGRALLVALIATARADGHRALSLSVDARNAPALALYRSMGFVETGGQGRESDHAAAAGRLAGHGHRTGLRHRRRPDGPRHRAGQRRRRQERDARRSHRRAGRGRAAADRRATSSARWRRASSSRRPRTRRSVASAPPSAATGWRATTS